MGPFLLAIVVIVGIGFGASVALENWQKTADSAYVGSGARPDPDPKLRGVAPADKKG
jgi:hypothetical protein